MYEILLGIYILNATLLIVHEVDSAYWKEWELFKLPGGEGFFLILHIFLFILVLLGLVWLDQRNTAGLIISLILSLAGITAFTIHSWFIRKGHQEFNTRISQFILISTLLVSIFQLIYTVYVFSTVRNG
jgi:hypothetical protein